MGSEEFEFGSLADDFENHIALSIPGYHRLRETCVALSQRFVQSDTSVLDIGCSTGALLRQIETFNSRARSGVRYIGLDSEQAFQEQWLAVEHPDINFAVVDCRTHDYADISFAVSLFTVQFLPPADKVNFLRSLWCGMLPGAGLIIAEKVYAQTGRMQDALTFPYYDRKLPQFTADEILEKERRLRGLMTLWTYQELQDNLLLAGFRDLELVWANFPFVATLALK